MILRARAQLLEQAGYPEVNGVRFHLTMKASTEESTRLMAAVLQQQFREVGIALDIRTFEFATFFSDVTHGLFQLYSLRWIGGNEDPDIFEYIFHSVKWPPNGANRGYFADPGSMRSSIRPAMRLIRTRASRSMRKSNAPLPSNCHT